MLRRLLSHLHTRRELLRLSDRALCDIGIEPEVVRPPAGPSPLVLQPSLLAQLRDPPPTPASALEPSGPRHPLWIIHLRPPATRPI